MDEEVLGPFSAPGVLANDVHPLGLDQWVASVSEPAWGEVVILL